MGDTVKCEGCGIDINEDDGPYCALCLHIGAPGTGLSDEDLEWLALVGE
jgi:hypothetical protein